MDNSADFWTAIDSLLAESQILIDRPKGSTHPSYPDTIYPLDYGYLANTSSADGEGIDCWVGSKGRGAAALICTVDLQKRDSELKLLIGCTESETETALQFHNSSPLMKGLLIRR